jgi:predicted SAM-dependent methyltransferase
MQFDNYFIKKISKPVSIIKTIINLNKNKNKTNRKLEIGPGLEKISDFETVNITNNKQTDYICDASKRLPFPDNTFSLIYASHIFEHTPWYLNSSVLKEWTRVLKKKGRIEIWVPDGYKICKAFVKCEDKKTNQYIKDNWFKFNDEKDPCIWVNSRIFTYGDGTGKLNHPNWHYSLFSYRYIEKLLKECGLKNIIKLTKKDIRGYDHGWINLGISGEK